MVHGPGERCHRPVPEASRSGKPAAGRKSRARPGLTRAWQTTAALPPRADVTCSPDFSCWPWCHLAEGIRLSSRRNRLSPTQTGMCVRHWLFCSLRNCVLPPPAQACSVSGLRPTFPGTGKWPSQHCWSWRPGPSVARPLPHPLTSSSGVKSCTQGLRCCRTPRSTSDRPPGIVTLHAPSRVATCLSIPKRWDIRNKVTLQGQTVRSTGRKWPRDLEMQRTPGPRRPTLPWLNANLSSTENTPMGRQVG